MPTDTPIPNYQASRLSAFALIGWLLLSSIAFYVAVGESIDDHERDFRHEATETALEIRQKLQGNLAVLSGFAVLLGAVDSDDRDAAARFARAATSTYPHLYMLQVAREIPGGDRAAFEAEMKRHGEPGFSLRQLSTQGGRRWQAAAERPRYWPLVFHFPNDSEDASFHGLDLASIPSFAALLDDAARQPAPVVSTPFRLAEGEPGFVMLRTVSRSPAARPVKAGPLGGNLIAILMTKGSALRPGYFDARDSVRAEWAAPSPATVTDHGEPTGDTPSAETSGTPPLFVQAAEPARAFDRLLPELSHEMQIEVGPQVVRLIISRQLRWSDLSGFMPRAVALLSLLSLTLVLVYLKRHYLAIELVQREHERAEYLAMHDPLTDLPNRRLLADRVHQAQLRFERSGSMFALFLIDLDHFKTINDHHGHEGGDQLLKIVARRLSSSLRASDTIARYGGDEFVVIIADVLGEQEARLVAEKLLAEVSEPIVLGDEHVRVTCSLGIALCPRDGDDFETLSHQADHAMYRVKASGRNAVCSDALGPFVESAGRRPTPAPG